MEAWPAFRPAGKLKHAPPFFMKFRGPRAHPNRFEKPGMAGLPAGWQAKACPTKGIEFFMSFRGPQAHSNRVEEPPRTSGNSLSRSGFFMKFRGRNAHPNRPQEAMVCPTCF